MGKPGTDTSIGVMLEQVLNSVCLDLTVIGCLCSENMLGLADILNLHKAVYFQEVLHVCLKTNFTYWWYILNNSVLIFYHLDLKQKLTVSSQ